MEATLTPLAYELALVTLGAGFLFGVSLYVLSWMLKAMLQISKLIR